MENKDIIEFFDSLAPSWDDDMIKSDEIIDKILQNAKMSKGLNILDVACGTGVMFDYYLTRGAASVTGIDISPKMAQIAKDKYADNKKITVVCGDVLEAEFDKKFDLIVVYNAFPHFPNPSRLIAHLASLLKDGGRLTVAHGMSREKIDAHHKGGASKVSVGLISENDLAAIFSPYFTLETVLSDDTMYQVSGKLKGVQ